MPRCSAIATHPTGLGSRCWGRHPLLEAAIVEVGIPRRSRRSRSRSTPTAPFGASIGTSAATCVALIGALDALTSATAEHRSTSPGRRGVSRPNNSASRAGSRTRLAAAFGGDQPDPRRSRTRDAHVEPIDVAPDGARRTRTTAGGGVPRRAAPVVGDPRHGDRRHGRPRAARADRSTRSADRRAERAVTRGRRLRGARARDDREHGGAARTPPDLVGALAERVIDVGRPARRARPQGQRRRWRRRCDHVAHRRRSRSNAGASSTR